jgi:hypothetical protein
MNSQVKKLTGANMDIDLATPAADIAWQQAPCPWNQAETTNTHRCAVKNISICPYFCGIEYLDTLLCSYPNSNSFKKIPYKGYFKRNKFLLRFCSQG